MRIGRGAQLRCSGHMDGAPHCVGLGHTQMPLEVGFRPAAASSAAGGIVHSCEPMPWHAMRTDRGRKQSTDKKRRQERRQAGEIRKEKRRGEKRRSEEEEEEQLETKVHANCKKKSALLLDRER